MRNCLLIGILALALPTVLQAETPLTDAEVVKVWKAGLDEIILAKIDGAGRAAFALDTDIPIELKKSGVSRVVISAMLGKASGRSGGTDDAPAPGAVPQMHPFASNQQDNPRYYSDAGQTVPYNTAKERSNVIARI